jgi:hypothetical protein
MLVAILASCDHGDSIPLDCSSACQVEITGLKATYYDGSRMEVAIKNRAENDLEVNVAVEGLKIDYWREVAGSVSDPDRSFAKARKLTEIKKGTSFTLSFVPCETPMIVDGAAITKPKGDLGLRLRVDVYSKSPFGFFQKVRSPEFGLSCGHD